MLALQLGLERLVVLVGVWLCLSDFVLSVNWNPLLLLCLNGLLLGDVVSRGKGLIKETLLSRECVE